MWIRGPGHPQTRHLARSSREGLCGPTVTRGGACSHGGPEGAGQGGRPVNEEEKVEGCMATEFVHYVLLDATAPHA